MEVTNCWPNRLIGDEYLPEEATYNSTIQDYAVEAWPPFWQGAMKLESKADSIWGTRFGPVGNEKHGNRETFGAWKHYNSINPLFESGLLGPVTLTKVTVVTIGVWWKRYGAMNMGKENVEMFCCGESAPIFLVRVQKA